MGEDVWGRRCSDATSRYAPFVIVRIHASKDNVPTEIVGQSKTEEDAKRASEDLARQFPGVRFGYMKVVNVCQIRKPEVDWLKQ